MDPTTEMPDPEQSSPAVQPSVSEQLSVGELFDDKYLITGRLGSGGFGVVYEGRDLALGVPVAIKVLREDVSRDAQLQHALQEEARRVTRIKHPNIVDWKSFSRTETGTCYFVMERLEGENLETVLEREGVLLPDRASDILRQILEALCVAHNAGTNGPILHLDLKPSNVFLEPHPSGTDGDWVKLIDFGVGQFAGHSPEGSMEGQTVTLTLSEEALRPRSDDNTTLVSDGAESEPVSRVLSCTPNYAAPEHGAHLLRDVEVVELDHRSDLYSLGVIAYRMLAGCLPFHGGAHYESVLRVKLERDPPSLTELSPRVPRTLSSFVDRCLRRRREDRWETTEEAYQALLRHIHRNRRRSVGVAAVSLLGAGLLALVNVTNQDGSRFDLYHTTEAGTVDVSRSTLHLGSERRTLALDAAGIARLSRGPLRCLQDPSQDASVIPWLSAAWREDGRIGLEALDADERMASNVYVEIAAGEGEPVYSEPFQVVFLPGHRKRIVDVFVDGQEGRAIDPVGQSVRVRVALPGTDVDRVVLRCEGGESVASSLPALSNDRQTLFDVDLSRLGLPTGTTEFAVLLADRAGGREEARFPVEIASEALAFTECAVAGTRVGSHVVLDPRLPANLLGRVNGVADVHWSVHHEDGRHLSEGSLLGVTSFEEVLETIVGDQDFEGWIEVTADDRRFVHRMRSRERGRAVTTIAFVYTRASPELFVQAGPATMELRELVSGRPVYSGESSIRLRITRMNSIPTKVSVHEVTRAEAGEELATFRLQTRKSESWDGTVHLEPGAHQLEFRAWRILSVDGDRPAEWIGRATIVVDVEAPTLKTADVPADGIRITRASAPGGLRLSVEDNASRSCRVSWVLLVDDGGEAVVRGDAGDRVGIGEWCEIALTDFAKLPDESYSLRVLCVDEAGNESDPRIVSVTVGVRAPTLRMISPDGTAAWAAKRGGRFPLEVQARDPNGVERVFCRVGSEERGYATVELESKSETNLGASLWTGEVNQAPWWAERDVHVRVHGIDTHGNEATIQVVQTVGTLAQFTPSVIAVRRAEVDMGRMALVQGNAHGIYTFGGRGDEVESRLFREAGLPPFNPLSVNRSWRIQYPAGQLGDFYLQETEVTVGQFLVFLRAEDGFANRDHWSADSPPARGRRESLIARLGALDPVLPVTDVTWDEARAFAGWTGRRLCTFVEWEYATRNGLKYQPCSYYDGNRQPRGIEVNLDAATGGGPWPVHRGDDRVPDTGLRNLSSNVAEWTQTPDLDRFFAGDLSTGTDPEAGFHLVFGPRDLARAGFFWITGSSFRDTSPTFLAADIRRRGWSSSYVGFRCAISAEEVVNGLGRELRHGHRLEVVK